jgi:hypothetical protein
MKIRQLIGFLMAVGTIGSIIMSPTVWALRHEQHRSSSASSNKEQPHNTAASLVGFRGLELLPSQDSKWLPGEFDDLQSRGGIAALPLGLATITNAFSEPESQLGGGLKFSFELLLVERKDGTLLLVRPDGNPIALYDPRSNGRQTFPYLARERASRTSAGAEISFVDGSRFGFTRLKFPNYRGESLYLLSSVRSPGGKVSPITFTIDDRTKTAVYSKVGKIMIAGHSRTGRVAIQDAKVPALKFALEYEQGLLKLARGSADELLYGFTTTAEGFVSSLTDKFGYKTSLNYSQGLFAGMCNHYGACVETVYGKDFFSVKTNTHNYQAMTRFDIATGLPTEVSYAGATTRFTYESSRLPMRYRLKEQVSESKTGAKVAASYVYDAFDRLTQYRDSLGYHSSYQYSSNSAAPFREPLSIQTTLAGNTIRSLVLSHNAAGRVVQVQDLLVRNGSPHRQIKYAYNSKNQLVEMRLGDGTVRSLRYENASYPDIATTRLVNGNGVKLSLANNGMPSEVTYIPSNARVSYQYSSAGLPQVITTEAPSMGTQGTWRGTYAAGVFLGSEQVQETAQGVSATTYQAGYKWDPLYRSIVERTRGASDLHTGLPTASSVNMLNFLKDSALTSSETTVSKPPGVREDASGCSVCAQPVEYDASTGATVPGSSQCDPLVSLYGVASVKDSAPIK